MITIYQIQLTDDQITKVNTGNVVEAFDVRMKMSFGFDRSKFSEKYLKHYTKSWVIDTDSLDEAFEVSNSIGEKWKGSRIGRAHSGSVGDIFVNNEGDCFICDTYGFVEVGYYDLPK
jgi:hypothetical protein